MEKKTPEKRAENPNFQLCMRAPEGTPLRVTSFPVITPEKRGGEPPTCGCAYSHPREPLRGHVTSGSPIGHAHIVYYYYGAKCTGCACERNHCHRNKSEKHTHPPISGCACVHPRGPLRSCHIVTSGDVTFGCACARSLSVAPPHRSTRNATFSVPIYYCLKIRKRYSESVNLYQDMCVFRHRRSQRTLY